MPDRRAAVPGTRPCALDGMSPSARSGGGEVTATLELQTAPLMEIRSVTKKFGPVPVLDDVSLIVERGKTTSLVGESGSGKSTLARIVTGLEKADSGTVSFRGQTRH